MPAAVWAERLFDSANATFADGQTAALLFRNLAIVELQLDRRAEAELCLERLDEILNDLKLRPELAEQPANHEWLSSQLRELSDLRNAVSGKR